MRDSIDVINEEKHRFSIIYHELLDDYGAIIRESGLAVYMALSRRAGNDKTCFPSLADICAKTGMSRSSVYRTLKTLELECLITSEKSIGETTLYTLHSMENVKLARDKRERTSL